jgi:flavin reductase (DIM6/NTAB) family NADH-FMN oxidoreductase RutF
MTSTLVPPPGRDKLPLLELPVPDEFQMVGFDTTNMDHANQYKLFSSTVIPRPIALVTTIGPAGPNAAPFSFFNAVAVGPPMVMFSVGPTMFDRKNEDKDTLVNIRATGEFVVHLVDDANKEKMNLCGPEYGKNTDETTVAGFRCGPSRKVAPPRIVDCPVQLECKVTAIHPLGQMPYFMIVGEVVFAHYREGIVDNRLRVDMTVMDPIARLVNPGIYCRITDHFHMAAPDTK